MKPKAFFENRGHAFVENAMILTRALIQTKILMFLEVGAPQSSFWCILWILDLYETIHDSISDLKTKEIDESVIFAKLVEIGFFEHLKNA